MTADNIDADPRDGRDETQQERHDRNWIEILEELRVIQTGTQILTGVLLTLSGTAMLVFDVVVGLLAGLIAGVLALPLITVLWVALPLGVRPKHPLG